MLKLFNIFNFTERETEGLHHISVKDRNNSLNQEKVITKITSLISGSFVDVVAVLETIAAIIILANKANGFQLNPHHVIVQPHLQWLYRNNYKPG